MKLTAINCIDFYKSSHHDMYPKGTEFIYSNFTPRSSKLAQKISSVFDDKVVFVGLQGFAQWYLIDLFNDTFFKRDKTVVVAEYKRKMDNALGEGAVTTEHIEALHDLGFLPLRIKALPEGSLVNMKVPVFTITNTLPAFYWLPNYIETVISSEIWKPSTTATTARQYRLLLEKFAEETGGNKDFIMWQGHDFSNRGMSGAHDGGSSSIGHLLSFYGTDTLTAIDYLENYYKGYETFVGGSVPASEHSVSSLNIIDNADGEGDKLEAEKQFFKRYISELYPSGVCSYVSDTFDFFSVITEVATYAKDLILARKENALGLAKVVFRPDSGCPIKILCGDEDAEVGRPEYKGSVEVLWDIFGGTVSDKGYKTLNQRVGLIYGDSITLERAETILQRLKDKGFASDNVVFGIGSYTYQFNTRDSYGFAMKATHAVVNGVARDIYKDPKTGDGLKKSAKGLLRVEKEGNDFVLYDQQTPEQEQRGELKVVFENGKVYNTLSLEQIRNTLWK